MSSSTRSEPGKIDRRSHDYYRHGTTTLFAALEIATGQVTAALKPKHRHQEFLAFLRQIERTYRGTIDEHGHPVELHLVMDNYAAHKHKNVKEWLAANPRFKVHFTPTHASWMNLVEVWFGLVERQAVRRGVFKSVPALNAKLRAYIDGWNRRAHPFVWTKTADEILLGDALRRAHPFVWTKTADEILLGDALRRAHPFVWTKTADEILLGDALRTHIIASARSGSSKTVQVTQLRRGGDRPRAGPLRRSVLARAAQHR